MSHPFTPILLFFVWLIPMWLWVEVSRLQLEVSRLQLVLNDNISSTCLDSAHDVQQIRQHTCSPLLDPIGTEVSNILVQLFWHNEYKESMEYVLFSELWSLSHSQQGQLNKHFALLSSASLLCLLGVSSEAFSQTQELHGEANEVYRIVHRHLPLVHEAVVELSRKKCSKTNRG